MNEIISQVTPLTRGIIWHTHEEWIQDSSPYQAIDYLLDGLLTSSLIDVNSNESQIFVGKNFGLPFFVLITKDLSKPVLENFANLFAQGLTTENDILVIHQGQELTDIHQSTPENLKNKIRFLK